jgi:hypothetical protein
MHRIVSADQDAGLDQVQVIFRGQHGLFLVGG